MPYDDSNIKKMIKDQLERKVGFSRSKVVSPEAKDLIRKILEVNVNRRYTLPQILAHPWFTATSAVNSDKPGPSGNIKAEDSGKAGDGVGGGGGGGRKGSRTKGPGNGDHSEEHQTDETVVAMV